MQSAGSLKLTSFEDVLKRIAMLGQSGVLEVKRSDVIREFFIENGSIQSCASNVPGEQISQLVLWHRMLDASELRVLYAKSKEKSMALGQALIQFNVLSEEKMIVLLRTKVEDSLIDTMSWDDGRFRFVEGNSFHAHSTKISVSLEDFIGLINKHAFEYKSALQAISSVKNRFWICRDEALLEEDRGPQSELLWESIEEGLTVEEAILELHGRRVFVFLELAKWIENNRIKLEKRGRNRVQNNATLSAQQFMAEVIKYQNQSEQKKAFMLCRRATELFPNENIFSEKLLEVEETLLAKLIRKYLADYRVPKKNNMKETKDVSTLNPNEELIFRKVDGCWDMLSLVYLVPMRPIDALLAVDTLVTRKRIVW